MRRIAALFALILPLVAITPSYARPLAETPTTKTITATIVAPATFDGTLLGSLSEQRSYPSQTLLVDGSVLIAGGTFGLQYCPDTAADLYNPATGKIERVGNLLYNRGPNKTTLLEDGRVFVQPSGYSDCESPGDNALPQLYNPATRSFEPTPEVLPRFAILLGNGAVLAYKGREVQLCKPLIKTCAPRTNLIIPRSNFAATRLADGDVLITGGTAQPTNAELYTPSTGVIALTGTPTISTTTPGVVLQDGRVVFTNDSQAEIYDPQTRTFKQLTVPSNTYFLGPKFRAADGNVVFLNEEEKFTVYNPTSNLFTTYRSRYNSAYTATVLPDTTILFVGNNYQFTNEVYRARYVPANTITGSLTYPTSWVQKQTIKIAVKASSTSAPIAEVGLQTSRPGSNPVTTWTPYSTTVSPTIDLLMEGVNRPVTLLLRDSYGGTVTIGTGYVKVDLTAPVSQMAQLPTYSRRTFVASWSGSDSLSGIEGYTVEMRVGTNGAWQRIASNVKKTTAGASGTQGQQLFFRVRARDVAGNVEAWPADNDTQTIIDTVGPTGVLDVSYVGQGSVQMLIATQDAQSGTQDMRVGFSYNFDQTQWEPLQSSKTLNRLNAPAGCLRVYAQFRDRAGNIGPIVQAIVPGTGCS